MSIAVQGANPILIDNQVQEELLIRVTHCKDEFNPKAAWIQTYSGIRFTPTEPVVSNIIIQDIAHSLSMQCRFTGHVNGPHPYTVAQHSVLVSYLCDTSDALEGLLHDATEAYLVDIPAPLKRSGLFDAYMDFESLMAKAIDERFGLKPEPESVKLADKRILACEARDFMCPIRDDWDYPYQPIPFYIKPVAPTEAKDMFLKRFYELAKTPNSISFSDWMQLIEKVI